MISNYLLGLYGILVCYVAVAVAREAIIGGDNADFFRFPYQVSIEIAGYGHGCGGAIIDNESILTAASCVIARNGYLGGRPIFVLAGTKDLDNTALPAVTVQVKKIYVPMDYEPGLQNTTGDIAILRLNSSLAITKRKIYKRVSLERNKRQNYDGKIAKIAGYGWTWIQVNRGNQNGGRNDSLLRYAKALVLSHRECRQEHPTLNINEKHLCAKVRPRGNIKRGVCVGDGGSPLVYNGTAIGIFSFGANACNESITSAVYTRISYYLKFIRRSREGFKTKFMHEIDLS